MTPPLATRLRALLARKGYSIADAASVAGMARQQLHEILSGKRANPGVLTLERIVEAVGGTLSELFADDG